MSDEIKNQSAVQSAIDSVKPPKGIRTLVMSEDQLSNLEKAGFDTTDPFSPLKYAIQQSSGSASKKAPSLAYIDNPVPNQNYQGLYKYKSNLLPDEMLKQIRVTDGLVAAILRSRGAMVSLFGNLKKDRFDVGIQLEIKKEYYKALNPEQFAKVTQRMKRFETLLLNCGHNEGLEQQDHMTFADFLDQQVRNGCTFGRFATEIIYDRSVEPDQDGKFPFHRFRQRDVATIKPAVRKGDQVGDKLRSEALRALSELRGETPIIDSAKLEADEYAWIQVVEGQVRSAFTHDEMLVYNLYEDTDIEHNGYPVSPMDTVVSSITTHISIDAYRKLYFQNGRATRGMLVIQSDEVDEAALNNIKLQFNAAINNVANSFRTPIFGMGSEDEVKWVPFAGEGAQDQDFQYMADQTSRDILSAFSMSPDELPGYSHLSRGTNSQTLSESNNEYRILASRDTGIRPLILKLQTFINNRLFPLMDPYLAKICEVRFSGLDAQSKEQESTRLQQDMPTWMTYDDVLKSVDKDPVGPALGGNMPFNERVQLINDKFSEVGEVKGRYFNDPSSFVDPMMRYKRDPFFLQYLQLLAQASPSALQAFFAPKPHAMDFLKMCIEDSLEGDECE